MGMDVQNIWFQQDGATQRISQSIYWKASLENVLYHEMVQSMVSDNKPATFDELHTNIESEIAAVSARGGHAIESFIQNGIERTSTGLENFVDSHNRFCFI